MNPFPTFDAFYAHYMGFHQNVWNRRVHLLGWLLGAAVGAWALWRGWPAAILLAPVPALAAIWLGHRVLEPTDAVEFSHPLLTARANLRMFAAMLSGRLRF